MSFLLGLPIFRGYHGPPKPTFLEVFLVNNLVFRWPKPLFFMVLGAHGMLNVWGVCLLHFFPPQSQPPQSRDSLLEDRDP